MLIVAASSLSMLSGSAALLSQRAPPSPAMHLREQIGTSAERSRTTTSNTVVQPTGQSTSLKEKVAKLRNELNVAEGQTLAETVDRVVLELGLESDESTLTKNVAQKVETCLQLIDGQNACLQPVDGEASSMYMDARAAFPRSQPALGYGGSVEMYGGYGGLGGFSNFGGSMMYGRGSYGSFGYGYGGYGSSYGSYGSYGGGYGGGYGFGAEYGYGSGGVYGRQGLRQGLRPSDRVQARRIRSTVAAPSAPAPSATAMSLQQKVETIRDQLDVAEGQTLAETVDTAVQELGLCGKSLDEALNVAQKIDACLEQMTGSAGSAGLAVESVSTVADARTASVLRQQRQLLDYRGYSGSGGYGGRMMGGSMIYGSGLGGGMYGDGMRGSAAERAARRAAAR